LHGVPDGFHIIPGMPVTADVKVGKRTVLKYLLGMMLPVTREAMREP
jgi:hemolysin D